MIKVNYLLVIVVLIIVISGCCFFGDRLLKTDNQEKVEIKIKDSKAHHEINKIKHDDFERQFGTIPVDLKRKLNDYEALNYHTDGPVEVDSRECTQKQLDNITRCQNARLMPSFQTTPEIPDGTFMAGQKPVCHIDRVRAIEDFSCPVNRENKIKEDPCKLLCKNCVVGYCKNGICY